MITTMKTTSALEKEAMIVGMIDNLPVEDILSVLERHYAVAEQYLGDTHRLSIDARYHWLEWTFVLDDIMEFYKNKN